MEKIKGGAKFVLLGLGGTLVYFGANYAMTTHKYLWISSIIVSSLLGAIVSFIVHKLWTFKNTEEGIRQMHQYAILSTVYSIINFILVAEIKNLHIKFLVDDNWINLTAGAILLIPNLYFSKKIFKNSAS